MMLVAVKGSLGQSFLRGANQRAYERALRQHHREQEERREKRADAVEADADFIDLASVAITTEQAEVFQAELDIYQAATVEALLENEKALELVDDKLELLMRKAHVLEDGRRVFKTEDGLRVFDEDGNELGKEIIDPDDIADDRPRWETIEGILDQREALQSEREQLFDFQERLDSAQERLDSGEMTQKEFDRIREDLTSSAPEVIKSKVPELFSDDEVPIPAHSPTSDIDLDAELSAMPAPRPFGTGLDC